nr:PREDICTED: calcium-independent phospholipase A2-gamma-like isoform X1 [Bemisia tabaci]
MRLLTPRGVMSLSKGIRHYRKCMCQQTRHINAQKSVNDGALEATLSKLKMSPSHVKNKSLNDWKVIVTVKNLLMRLSNEKMLPLKNDWYLMLQKFPKLTGVTQIKFKGTDSLESAASLVNPALKPAQQSEITKTSAAVPAAVPPAEDADKSRLPNVFHGLTQRLASSPSATTVPAWVTDSKTKLMKERTVMRTKHIITSISSAVTIQSRVKRLEDLIDHLREYPDAQIVAAESGAISLLLQLQRRMKDDVSQAILRESLALVGYSPPLPKKGIRILCIDGGGIRGLVVIEILKELERLSGQKVHKLFDYICGVSTGAIILSLMGPPTGKSLSEISDLYKEMSIQLFKQNSLRGMSNLVMTHGYYDSTFFEKLLKDYAGEFMLTQTNRDPNCPKLASISAVVNKKQLVPHIFRNYSLPHSKKSKYIGGNNYRIWEAVRASGAAPTVFAEFPLGEFLHQDGGIMVNNPTAVAIHEASLLWPDSEIQCVVSCGTGRLTPIKTLSDEVSGLASSSWRQKFYRILDSATDTEAVHTALEDTLPKSVYFRFNPFLSELLAMDEIRPEKIKQLLEETGMYLQRNEDKMRSASKALLEEKTMVQNILNFLKVQTKTLGIQK